MADWRQRLLGGPDRLGLWTLPVFLAVGLAGSVLAGTVAVVYYSQQVSSLRDEVRADREELRNAVEEVEQAREEALSQIQEQLSSFQEAIQRGVPISDAFEAGVVQVRAFRRPPPRPEPSPPSSPSPTPDQQASPAAAASRGGVVRAAAQEQPDEEPDPSPEPRRRGRRQIGSAFPVVQAEGETFYATTHAVLADPNAPQGVTRDVALRLADRTVEAEVHSWDADLDIALVRARVGEVELLEWRPLDEPLELGDTVAVVGLTEALSTGVVTGSVVASEPRALSTDVSLLSSLRGAPLVDSDGRVIAIASSAYAPGGSGESGRTSPPVQLLCEELLNCPAGGAGGG